MYSGIHGTELRADIFLGVRFNIIPSIVKLTVISLIYKVVFYQRLRHMVSDKYQVRSTGPIDKLTQQPVKVRPSSPIVFQEILKRQYLNPFQTYLGKESWRRYPIR